MNRDKHYRRAEELLEEGVKVVRTLALLNKDRGHHLQGTDTYGRYTASMDELGKKAMGIWAQAQVHATLATTEEVVA